MGAVPAFLPTFLMWLAMTGVMMAPVVFPWLRALLAVGIQVESPCGSTGTWQVVPFAAGYAVAWVAFSAVAATLHRILLGAGVPVPFGLEAPVASATALLLAGVFQLTRLKDACLVHCRSPAGYLLTHWRDGLLGRTRMGLAHGVYCLGCCWALMLLALVVGMVHLWWMALLMVVMVVETGWRHGRRVTRPLGVSLIGLAAVVWILR